MTPRRVATALMLSGLLALPACGGDDGGTAASGDDPDSPYCRLAAEWAVHEMAPRHDDDPAWLRTYMAEYRGFLERSAQLAPSEIRRETELSRSKVISEVIPVLERYGYSVARIAAEATPAEKGRSQPPRDVAEAQTRVLAYEARVCATQQPAVSGVSFGGSASEQYCDAAVAIEDAFDAAGTEPGAVRELLTSDRLRDFNATAVKAAPEEIREDAVTFQRFFDERVQPVVARFGYDIRRVMLEGSAQDRAVLNSTDPAVRDAYVRTTAYYEQFCG